VLAALRRAGHPYELSPGQLVAETLVTSGTMTNRLDRLEARALVSRRPDPTDRRGVIVVATSQGLALADTALAALLQRERALLSGLEPTAQGELATLLRRLVVRFDEPR
jgi:DNA-binding MarR family transcriptional regulator